MMFLKFYDRIRITSMTGDFALSTKKSGSEKKSFFLDEEELAQNGYQMPQILQKNLEKISTLDELRHVISTFDGCELKKNARNTVLSDGNPTAKIMLIGEAPGEQEDKLGIPFCGRSGHLLDKMLQAINLDRTTVYITNTVFWRPPGNRRPTNEEIEVCRPFVEHHIRLVSPKLIVLLGSTAASSLLKSQERISMMRNKLYEYKNPFIRDRIPTIVTFHPSYLLRQPMQKKLAWEDLKLVRAHIDNHDL